MRRLIINGWPLAHDAVGIGVYGRRLARLLATHAQEMSITVTVAAPRWLVPRLAIGDVDLVAIASPHSGHALVDEILWSQRLASWARGQRGVFLSPAPFWSARSPGRTIVFQHDRITHFFPRYLGRRFLRRWLARRQEAFLATADAILTHSRHSERDLLAISGVRADQVHVITPWLPEGYSPEAAREAAAVVRAKYALPARFWLYVGGYDYRKNVELLLRAYARVAAKPTTPPLVLAGRMPPRDGPYCDVEGTLGSLSLPADRIVRPGFVAASDLPGLYGAAELMIYPSRYEGFGLPPLEAISCGCPAICADTSSLPEVVSDANYRFKDDDEDALVKMLAEAGMKPLQLNPSFSEADFSEAAAVHAYARVLAKVSAS